MREVWEIMVQMLHGGKLYAVYWRNPDTRAFEKIPNAVIYGKRGEGALEIRPAHAAKWYTIIPGGDK